MAYDRHPTRQQRSNQPQIRSNQPEYREADYQVPADYG